MSYLKLIIVISMCILSCTVAIAGPTWVEVRDSQDNPPDIDLKMNTTDSIVFTVTIPGFYKTDTTYDDTTYQRIWFLR